MKASMSEISSFLTCRRQWYWGSFLNLGHTGGYTAPALALGTAIHAALEQYYGQFTGGHTLDAVTPMECLRAYFLTYKAENAGELPLEDGDMLKGFAMLRQYTGNYGIFFENDPDIAAVYSTEQEFIVSVPGTKHYLVGTIDGIFRRKSAREEYWLIDHKTYTSAPRTNNLVLNQQFLGYTWAAQRLSDAGVLYERFGIPKGARISGVLYNGLRKQIDGPTVKAPLFNRQFVGHLPAELPIFTEHLQRVFFEMSHNPVTYVSPGDHCGWCDFNTPCVAAQLGEDADAILEASYVEKLPRGVVYEKELRLD